MNNEPKTDVLLRMMEQPERYTEEQWRDILSDSECRELYTLMALTKGAIDANRIKVSDEDVDEAWKKVKDPPLTLQDPPLKSILSEHSIVPSSVHPLREGVVTSEDESMLPSKHSTPLPTREGQGGGSSSLHRIAAIFLAAAFLGGLAWAIAPLLRSRHTAEPPQPTEVSAPSLTGRAGGESAILFADIRLDSMLTTIAAHYGKAVFFGNEDLKGLRIHTKWNPKDSLEAFMESLNELDGLKLTEQRDTIFVQKGGVQ